MGIGTTNPATNLHIVATLPVITLQSVSSQTRIDFKDGSSGRATIGVNTTHSNAFCIATSSTGSVSLTNDARLVVATDGNVGIGYVSLCIVVWGYGRIKREDAFYV